MITRPRGTKDIYDDEMEIFEYIEEKAKKAFSVCGVTRIQIPTFENTELFERGVGGDTDIVQKEMYTFLDKSNRSMTLRPEGTAGTVRAYIENGMSSLPSPKKLWYMIPIYRYEKVQKGRQREFNQVGLEYFGSEYPESDYEVIKLSETLLSELGIFNNCTLKINSIGCSLCREEYKKVLREYVSENGEEYCEDCKRRMDTNILRVLDCKVEKCKRLNTNAPKITEYICSNCKAHFEKLQEYLKNSKIEYEIDPYIVRGLDYYNRTVFEILGEDGKAVLGGGRYDGLSETIDGPKIPAVGFAMGVERALGIIKENIEKGNIKLPEKIKVMIQSEDKFKAINLAEYLRKERIITEYDLMDRSFRSNLKYADKANFKYVIFLDFEEAEYVVRNLKTGNEKHLNEIHDILEYINS